MPFNETDFYETKIDGAVVCAINVRQRINLHTHTKTFHPDFP